jgi:hypothetical protein
MSATASITPDPAPPTTAPKPKRSLDLSVRIDVPELLRHIALVAAVGIGTAFFYPVFETWNFLLPVVALLIVCGLVALVAKGFRLAVAPSMLLVLVAAIFTMPGLARLPGANFGLPLPRALGSLGSAIANGPAEMLTLPVPVEATQSVLVVPLGIALLSFLLGAMFLHSSRPRFSVAGPVLAIVGSLSFGPRGREYIRFAAAGFLGAALVYLVVLDRTTRRKAITGKRRPMFPFASAAVLVGVMGVAVLIGPSLPFVQDRDRFTLRTYRELPFDPTQLPSPLSQYRRFFTPAVKNQVFFSASQELPKRWRLATLDAYDGTVWSVGKADANGDGLFQLVGARLRRKSEITVGRQRVAKVTAKNWREPWLPMPGPGIDIVISSKLQRSLRYNREGEVMALLDLSKPEIEYTVDWLDLPTPDPAALDTAAADFSGGYGNLVDVPPLIVKRAQEYTAGATTPYAKAKALEARLQQGYFSDAVSTGHQYGRMLRMLETPQSMQGNGEQYAALFGALGRSIGLPVRVVVGFAPPSQRFGGVSQIRGRDMLAWNEVNFAGVGWVPFDPIPEQSRRPFLQS